MLRPSVTVAALLGAACVSVATGFGAVAWAQGAAGLGDAGVGAGVLSTGTGPHKLADDGYRAIGLTDEKLAPAIVTLIVRGSLQAWDPGESTSVDDGTKPDWGTSTFTTNWDRSRGLYRVQWQRPRAGGGMRNYTEIITDEYSPNSMLGGYVMGVDVNGAQPQRAIMINGQPAHQMSGKRLTATLRELKRLEVIMDMHEHPERVSEIADQRAGGKTYPAAQYRADYGTYIVLYDRQTHLPAVIRTKDWEVHYGDTDYDDTLSDWRDIGMGIKLPFHQVITANGNKIFDITYQQVQLNPQLAVDAFTVPAALRRGAPPPASIRDVPFQWILRRMGNGFYLDSDALYTDDGGALRMQDVAPNTTFITGGSHNTMLVATNSYLVVFDAPGDDGLSNKVLEMAAQKYPGKPVRYVVLTHHHIDHTGGVRAYAAQGATLVVGKGDGAFWRKILNAPAGMNLYPLKGKVQAKVIEVDGKWSVNDAGREVAAYTLPTDHATGYIFPYVPDAKLGWVTDLWNPGAPVTASNPVLVNIVDAVKKAGVQPERFAGGHGAIGNYADVVKVVGAR